jgi:hypothetical protein
MKPSLFFILLLKLNVVNAQQASLTRCPNRNIPARLRNAVSDYPGGLNGSTQH